MLTFVHVVAIERHLNFDIVIYLRLASHRWTLFLMTVSNFSYLPELAVFAPKKVKIGQHLRFFQFMKNNDLHAHPNRLEKKLFQKEHTTSSDLNLSKAIAKIKLFSILQLRNAFKFISILKIWLQKTKM